MKIDAASIDELIAKSGPHALSLRKLDGLITEIAPQLERRLFAGPSITMIGYGELMWENMSSSGVWPVIAIAPQKHQISMYVAATRDGKTLVQLYGKSLGQTDCGKNCVRFKSFDVLNVNKVEALIRDAIAAAATQSRVFGRNCARPQGS